MSAALLPRPFALGVLVAASVFGAALTLTPTVARADDTRAAVQSVFDQNCVKCHGARRTSAGLDLTADATASIVGRASSQAPGIPLVDAGNPDGSYLLLKVTDRHTTAGEGARMPLGNKVLSADAIETIRHWIASGAP